MAVKCYNNHSIGLLTAAIQIPSTSRIKTKRAYSLRYLVLSADNLDPAQTHRISGSIWMQTFRYLDKVKFKKSVDIKKISNKSPNIHSHWLTKTRI